MHHVLWERDINQGSWVGTLIICCHDTFIRLVDLSILSKSNHFFMPLIQLFRMKCILSLTYVHNGFVWMFFRQIAPQVLSRVQFLAFPIYPFPCIFVKKTVISVANIIVKNATIVICSEQNTNDKVKNYFPHEIQQMKLQGVKLSMCKLIPKIKHSGQCMHTCTLDVNVFKASKEHLLSYI